MHVCMSCHLKSATGTMYQVEANEMSNLRVYIINEKTYFSRNI